MRTETRLCRWAFVCLLAMTSAHGVAQAVDDVIDVQQGQQTGAVAQQQQIDALDDETVALLSEYHAELERLEDLQTYNTNMRRMRASQEAEKLRLGQELKEVEVVRRDLLPLMVEMTDLLARFIELDQPLLLEEREARVATLSDTLNRSDVALGEKYRRVIEAYQIEGTCLTLVFLGPVSKVKMSVLMHILIHRLLMYTKS